MTTRADEIRTQVQEMVKQAVVQMEDVRGMVIRTLAERLDLDLEALRHRRDAMLRNLGEQSTRLVEQERVPLPPVVKHTLGKVNTLLGHLIEQITVDPLETSAEVEPDSVPRADVAQPASRPSNGSGRPSRHRKSGGKSGGPRKSRRPSETHQS